MTADADSGAACRRSVPCAALLGAILWFASCGDRSPLQGGLERRQPLSPTEALQAFQIADGFGLEVAAAEPNVADPIAIAFDENARLFVAEMRGYPFDPPPGGEDAGRIRLLEDRDADGVYETSRVFADGLHWPSGIACWKGGVFVTAAPDIVYLKDTSGDGVADVRRTVFTGFGTEKSEDIVNNLKWGMDHWIYGTTSYNGGTVRHAERAGGSDVPLGANDFRFHPVTEVIEAVEGTRGDFGNAFDDWGNRFGSNSGSPIIHAVFPLRHAVDGMEPQLLGAPIYESGRRVFPIGRPEPWRVARKAHWSRWVDSTHDMRARRFPPRELAEQGYFTGGAGLGIYRGAAYPSEFLGNAFTPEPAGNLVLRSIVERSGVTFRARRATSGKEFIASTDSWFRPVNFANGPDGCLYMVDMYREVIEDPSALPDEILDHVDYYTGQDMGRVYRIVPDGFARGARPQLGEASFSELVALLEYEDGWWRSTAHRLLFERRAVGAAGPLREAVRRSHLPTARLHALWSLEGLDQLDESTLAAALSDGHPALRRNAVLLSESRLATSGALRSKVESMAADEDAAVRFHVALAVSAAAGGDSSGILARILRRDPGDRWIRAAVLAGARQNSLALLDLLLGEESFKANRDATDAVKQLASNVAASDSLDAVHTALSATLRLSGPGGRSLRIAALSGVAGGLERAGSSLPSARDGRAGPELRAAIAAVLAEAPAVAADRAGASVSERTEAIRLLAWSPQATALRAVGSLLVPDEPAEIQLAAIRSLSALGGDEVGRILVGGWRSYSPAVRREAAETLFSRDERLEPFLDALEGGTVLAAQLDPIRRATLLEHGRPEIRRRAQQILTGLEAASPEDLVREYRSALEAQGDAGRGADVFDRECATCHRLGGTGHEVGPDLAERALSSREELLVDILDPNRSVQSNFVNYRLDAADGRVVTGLLARESASSVTLRRGEGVEDTVSRPDIDSLTSMGLSLMPEGLEDEIEPSEMADLLRFIRSQARQ